MKELKYETYQSIRLRIITHDLRPGVLLNEKDLMREYKIGRSPLREILIELQRDGLIQRFPRSGTLVTPMDLHLFTQVIEIRINLEGLAGSLAAERITHDQLGTLKQILCKVKELEGDEEDREKLKMLIQCEFDFHNTLYEATHNRKLRDILYGLHGISGRFWYYWVFKRQELLDQFDDAIELLNALEKRDSKRSEQIMRTHVQNFVNKIKDKIVNSTVPTFPKSERKSTY
jgi:DNA-binding GntR family transcriptional regulator